jgi:hypothetical protein
LAVFGVLAVISLNVDIDFNGRNIWDEALD